MKILLNCLDLIFALILLGPIFTKNKVIEPMYNSATSIFNHGLVRVERSTIKNGMYFLAEISGKIFIGCLLLIILFFYVLPKPRSEFISFMTWTLVLSFYIWFSVNWVLKHKFFISNYYAKNKNTLGIFLLGIAIMLFFPEISIFSIFGETILTTMKNFGYVVPIRSNSILNLIGIFFILLCIGISYLSLWIISLVVIFFVFIFVFLSMFAFKLFAKHIAKDQDVENKFLTFVLVSYLITQILLRFAYG